MRNIQILFFASITLFFAACQKDQDTARPVIKNVTVNGIASEEHDLDAGQTFTLGYSVSDNESLNQMKINIHPADDGHTHSGEGESSEVPNVGTWNYSQIVNLDDKDKSGSFTLTVPDTIQGHWHVEVNLIDESGNEAVEYVTTLHITNTDAPTFALTSTPEAINGVISLAADTSTFSISGNVNDEQGVALVEYELENHSTEEEVGSGSLYVGSATSAAISPTSFGPLAAGTYHLKIKARDVNGNGSVWFAEVEVN